MLAHLGGTQIHPSFSHFISTTTLHADASCYVNCLLTLPPLTLHFVGGISPSPLTPDVTHPVLCLRVVSAFTAAEPFVSELNRTICENEPEDEEVCG